METRQGGQLVECRERVLFAGGGGDPGRLQLVAKKKPTGQNWRHERVAGEVRVAGDMRCRTRMCMVRGCCPSRQFVLFMSQERFVHNA